MPLHATAPGIRRFARRLRTFYHTHEPAAAAVFFLAGVTWDALTLNRIDDPIDNVLLMGYLLLLGALITAAALAERGAQAATTRPPPAWLVRWAEWYPAAIQFLLGALFSAYVIFYLQSATLAETALFLLLLVGLLVANEFIHRRLLDLYLLLSLYFLACSAFFTFFLPVLTKTMGLGVFVVGNGLSLALGLGLVLFLRGRDVLPTAGSVGIASGLLVGLFGLMHVFYFMNWIPPVPLALRHGGVYHAVAPPSAEAPGAYRLLYEPAPWYASIQDTGPVFHRREGEAVWCFAAVFAPTDLERGLAHVWQVYDPSQRRWVATDRIAYDVAGGRDRGYRWYSRKRNVHPGRWRVDVETEAGRLVGRIPFTIVDAGDGPVELTERLYE